MLIQSLRTIRIERNYIWRRKLLGPSQIGVNIGDVISARTEIANMKVTKLGERINLASVLDVEVEKVTDYLKCWNGEVVKKGDIVAEKIDKSGMMITEIRITSNGMLDFSEINQGFLSVRTPAKEQVLMAGIAGRIESILPNKSIDIMTNVTKIKIYAASGRSIEGEFIYLSKTEKLNKKQLNGKIVCTDYKITAELLKEYSKIGINGLIINSISVEEMSKLYLDFENLYKELGYTICVLSCFGNQTMPSFFSKIFNTFEKNTLVKFDRSDKMLVISKSNLFPKEFIDAISFDIVKLRKGLQVKIMGGEYTGFWGKIKEIQEKEFVIVEIFGNQQIKVLTKNIFAF